MKQEFVKPWTDALRSGEYQQATGVLKRVEPEDGELVVKGFCCLGVLCDINKDAVGGEWNDKGSFIVKDDRATVFLSPHIQRLTEMRTIVGGIPDIQKTLTSMNDNGKSFDEIADFIDANWEKL